jgi:hypothetical protein
MPLFLRQDTLLSSFCRLYELKFLALVVPEMQQVRDWELGYLLQRWRGVSVCEFPDPRTRWETEFDWQKEVWRELVELVRELGRLEVSEGRGLGVLPEWASNVDEEEGGEAVETMAEGGEAQSASDGYTSETTLVDK